MPGGPRARDLPHSLHAEQDDGEEHREQEGTALQE